jgi:DNA processing protein
MAEDFFYWLALNLTPGVGSILFRRLLERFITPEAVFRASLRQLQEIEGLGEKVAAEIGKGPFEKAVKRELSLLDEIGGSLLTLKSERYPSRLKDIYDPPPLLYVRGQIKKEDDLSISIVGSRKTSPYGRLVTERISRELVRHGITIVSGMARGIDSVAHMAAVSEKGRTIAVLGCGVDVAYPRENRNLMMEIVEHGAVVSEFPMGSPPEGAHFPKRNRIISGLSLGVVVIEAGRQSGSLITASSALEQGRDVFAVPGNVGTTGSSGTNQLIKEGAKLVETSDDILEELLPRWKKEARVESPGASPEDLLPEFEKKLYRLIGDTPTHIDALIQETGFDAGRVSSLLMSLELRGLIAQWPGKCFTKKA